MKIDILAGRIFLFLSFLVLPFLTSTKTVDHELVPRLLGISIIVLLGIIYLIFTPSKSNSFFQSKIAMVWVGFVLIGLLSSFFALNFQESIFEDYKNFIVFCYASLLYYFIKESPSFEFDLSCFISGFLFLILGLGSFQLLFQQDKFKGFADIVSSMGNQNLFASMLVICLPFVFILNQYQKIKWIKIFTIVLGLTTLIFIFGIWSKSALVAFFSGLIFFGYIFILKYKDGTFYNSYKYYLLASIVLFISTLIGYLLVKYYGRWSDLFLYNYAKEDTYDGNVERIMFWRNSIKMFLEFPFLGVGPGNWKLFCPKYGISGWYLDKSWVQYTSPHNDYFWILSEYGILGFITYIYLIYLVFKGLLSKIKSYNQVWIFAAILSGFVAYLIDSFFSFPKERAMHLVFFAIYISFSINESSVFLANKLNRKLVYIILLFVSLFSIFFFYKRFLAEINLEKARISRSNKSWESCVQYAHKSEKMGLNITPSFIEPVSLTQGMAYDELGRLDSAYVCYERAYKTAPYHLYSMVQYAGVLYAKGNEVGAIDILDKIYEITPGFWFSWRLKSLILLKKGDIEGAWKALNSASWNVEVEYIELSDEIFKARLIRAYETLPEGNENLACLKIILENGSIPRRIDSKYNTESGTFLWLKENKVLLCDVK